MNDRRYFDIKEAASHSFDSESRQIDIVKSKSYLLNTGLFAFMPCDY